MTREKLPADRRGITHRFTITEQNGDRHKIFMTVNNYPDEPTRAAEVFITSAKEGSTIGGLLDTIGVLMSFCLQHGVPLRLIVDKLSHTRFEPSGVTENPEIRFTSSIVDYIARWMGRHFLGDASPTELDHGGKEES